MTTEPSAPASVSNWTTAASSVLTVLQLAGAVAAGEGVPCPIR